MVIVQNRPLSFDLREQPSNIALTPDQLKRKQLFDADRRHSARVITPEHKAYRERYKVPKDEDTYWRVYADFPTPGFLNFYYLERMSEADRIKAMSEFEPRKNL
jgi:hypothetical protein